MSKPIRVLLLEDKAIDAELNIRELRRAGFDPQWKRVETEADYLSELSTSPDLILADYSLPHFDGLRAAELLRARELDIPFILISGTIGEEAAVEAMKRGANDYLLKDRIGRLGTAVERALERETASRGARKVQEMLLASEARYRRLFEAAKDGILILDANSGAIEDVNPFLMEMLGYSRADFIGKQLWELGFFRDTASNKEAFLKLQSEGYIRYDDLPLKTKSGRPFWVEFVSNIYDVNGAPVIQCNIRDITERRRAESRLAAIVESSDDAIIGKDLDGIITNWNKGAEKLFGYSAGEIEGTSITRLTPKDFKDDHHHIIGKIRRGENVEPFDTLRQTKDGRRIDISITASPIKNSVGEVAGVSIVARDITERMRAVEALRESEEKFRQLADNVTDVFWMVSPDMSTIHYVNFAFETVWGRSVESLYADPQQWVGAILPEEHERVSSAFASLRGGQIPHSECGSIESRAPTAPSDGFMTAASWSKDAAGKVIRPYGHRQRHHRAQRGRRKRSERARGKVEQFHLFSVGRELQMVELKKEINEMSQHAGQVLPYDLSFLDESRVMRGRA